MDLLTKLRKDRCLIDCEQLSTPSQEIIDLFIQLKNYYKYYKKGSWSDYINSQRRVNEKV